VQPLACFFGREKTSDEAFQATARLSFLSKRTTACCPLRCLLVFSGGERQATDQVPTTVMLACLFYLNKFPRALGSSLVFSGGERQAMPGQSEAMARQSIALACLFYLKKVTGTACRFAKSQGAIKNLPSFLMGGSEATVI